MDHPTITDSRFANLKCKDAIVDRFYQKFGQRPDSGPKRDSVVVHLYWHGKLARLFFDTSGEALSKRNYRKIPLGAPMQETLAAATILATGWKGNGNFINPMCGSGTLAIEAAMIGLDRAPGLLRTQLWLHAPQGIQSIPVGEAAERSKGQSQKIDGGKDHRHRYKPEGD